MNKLDGICLLNEFDEFVRQCSNGKHFYRATAVQLSVKSGTFRFIRTGTLGFPELRNVGTLKYLEKNNTFIHILHLSPLYFLSFQPSRQVVFYARFRKIQPKHLSRSIE